MNTSTHSAASIAPHFIKFEVQRAIRIVNENGEHCRAIDARQDESILAPIMLDEDLYDRALCLMESEIDGKYFAFVARTNDEIAQQGGTLEPWDYSLTHSDGTYGGVVWRVLGYLSDLPNDAMQLWAGNDEAGVKQTCAAFQAMKDACDNHAAGDHQTAQAHSAALVPTEAQKPLQIVVDNSGGCIHGVYAKVPVDIVFLSHDKHDLDEYQLEQGYLSLDNEPVALFSQHVEGGGQPEVVDHYFAEHAKTVTV